MHPAFSILFFTTLCGVGQGLIVAIALSHMAGVGMADSFRRGVLALAEVLLLAGLAASFFHLGHKARAWRAMLMWRTSWMSREVIVLPAFIALNALWLLALTLQWQSPWARALPLLAVAGAFGLWFCTAMIYACLKFIQEWAHALTITNFILIGLSSGAVVCCALAALAGETALLRWLSPYALLCTLGAWWSRLSSLRRNARLQPVSTLQSATGIASPKLVQKSMGMSAGAFNTREFFHGASQRTVRSVKGFFLLTLFVLPTLLASLALGHDAAWPWVLAALVQAPGLIAERWFFFAQARHPQNLYYQTVS
jgi:DMSO reductase anchor subunit